MEKYHTVRTVPKSIEKYHTVRTVPKSIEKYHTVRTVPKSNREIVERLYIITYIDTCVSIFAELFSCIVFFFYMLQIRMNENVNTVFYMLQLRMNENVNTVFYMLFLCYYKVV
jgi:hypothetical protein